MKKIALFAFRGEPMCFVHVLLNGLDMRERGMDVAIILEGAATKAVVELAMEGADYHDLYVQVRDSGLIDCVCRACSYKMGVLADIEAQKLPFGTDMKGHPSMARYIEDGYEIITF
ncbi:MAG: cytoplasmic protein [Spirochaetes bacterium]|nr:cytoplasmic protein [Spirochaetota bacterium]